MALRRYKLERALERTLQGMRLRRPQREALEEFHSLIVSLDHDLWTLSDEEVGARIRELRPDFAFPDGHPNLSCVLATGVGKTRLMGAMMSYLVIGEQADTFGMFAPRTTILRKLVREAHPADRKYLFVDPGLLPAPVVWHAGNMDQLRPRAGDTISPTPEIFIFSPQSFVGGDRKVHVRSEFTGTSLANYVRENNRTVFFFDEAHHLGRVAAADTQAWTAALRDLSPKLLVGMTATPRLEIGSNVLYTYDLPTCLREKMYTKDVRVVVKQRSEAAAIPDEDWDRLTLDFAMDRLARKTEVIRSLVDNGEMQPTKPLLLVCAEDTAHADQVGDWLVNERALSPGEVLVVHSRRDTEEAVSKILAVEDPESPLKVVVNVHKLTEGWDVTNVFVIAPLRAMGTFTGAIQAMGRGLRLPEGRRLGIPEVDTLDVLCFGKESLQEILSTATSTFGDESEGEAYLDVRAGSDVDIGPVEERELLHVERIREVCVTFPTVSRVPVEPVLDFDPADLARLVGSRAVEFELGADEGVSASAESLKFEQGLCVKLTAGRVLAGLHFLADPPHRRQVEDLVLKVVKAANLADSLVPADWALLAEAIKERIDKLHRREEVSFAPSGETVDLTFDSFDQPVPKSRLDKTIITGDFVWARAYERIPLFGWKKSVHEAAAFDNSPEFALARVLDRDNTVDWWARNDPYRFGIVTPVGGYRPDFLFQDVIGNVVIVEVKGANFWRPIDSDPRVKALAADAWCETVNAVVGAGSWAHWVILDADVPTLESVGDFQSVRCNR